MSVSKGKLRHPAPSFLGEAGRDLWAGIVADLAEGWELDSRELHLLAEAAKVADDISALDDAVAEQGRTVKGSRGQTVVNPAIAEARQLRTLQLRLLSSLELADPAEASRSLSPKQARARKAANARWAGRR